MIDRNKVIKAIEQCESANNCSGCPYYKCSACKNMLMHDVILLLKSEPETPQPVRESTSDFVRFNQGNIVVIINRHYVTDAEYDPSVDVTSVCLNNETARYKGNIINKITGGE